MLSLAHYPSLGEALADPMVSYKTRLAVLEADRYREVESWTYETFAQRARAFGGALQTVGVAAGDRVAILAQNGPAWLLSATGALWAGAVLVPLDYKLTAPEQAALLRHAKPKVLVVEYPTWRRLRKEDLPDSLARIWVTWAPADEDLSPGENWEDTAQADAVVMTPRTREDVACIVYSSGTGGTPKGCMLSHGNYLAQAEVLAEMYPIVEGDRYFSILPTNHAIDFMCGYLVALICGATVVHQRTLRAEYLTWTMKQYGITHMALVPRLLKMFQEKIQERLDELSPVRRNVLDGLVAVNKLLTWRAPRHEVSSRLLKPIHDAFGGRLKFFFAGGAFVERECADFFQRLGIPVAIGYGLTEAGTVLTLNDMKPYRGDTVGRPIRGVNLEIRDANDEGIGEVWVSGPTVFLGYLEEPALTDEAIVDGWLRTGDLGYLDPAGHLKLVGRARNMIVTEGGKNVYPEDIEATFENVAGVEELCAFAANYIWPTGSMVGEQLVVVVRAKEDADIHAIVHEITVRNRRLADYKRVHGVVIWEEEFPRTASFKIKRTILGPQIAAAKTRADIQELEP